MGQQHPQEVEGKRRIDVGHREAPGLLPQLRDVTSGVQELAGVFEQGVKSAALVGIRDAVERTCFLAPGRASSAPRKWENTAGSLVA